MSEVQHVYACRVHYEDTDMAGVVYYANYLKFIERARSDWVRGLGIDQRALIDGTGIAFAVRRLEADYLAPARFDDLLSVETSVIGGTGARLTLRQRVLCGNTLLFDALVTLVAVGPAGRAARLPAELRRPRN